MAEDLASAFSDDSVNMGRDFGLVEGYLIRTGADPRIIAALGRIAQRFESDDEDEEPAPDPEEIPQLCQECGATADYDVDGVGLLCQEHYDELEAEEQENTCEKCGCTDSDCSGCIARTGKSCSWANEEKTLCTACEEEPAAEPKKRGRKKKEAEPAGDELVVVSIPGLEPEAKAAEEDRAWSQHRGDNPAPDRTDQPEENDPEGLDPALAEKAEQIKAAVRRMREWTPTEDKLIIENRKPFRDKNARTEFILDEINAASPDNPRTIGALYQRMTVLRGKGLIE